MAEDELNILRRVYSAISRGDADELRGSLTHDFELELPQALPWGGARHGPAGIETVLELFLDYVEGSWADPDEFLEASDRIVVLGRARGRARTTGEEFEVPFAHVWAMADGVPSRCQCYLDTHPVMAALGQAPSHSY